jgi:hypothetical protein
MYNQFSERLCSPLNYKIIIMSAYEHIKFSFTDYAALLWGHLTGVLLFLIGQPNLALYAIFSLIIFDIFTRLKANAANNGGYLNATKTGAIKSRKLFQGFFSKFMAYSIVLSMANMTQYFIPVEMIYSAVYAIVCSILAYVEIQSVLENLLEATPEGSKNRKLYNILLFVFRKKTEDFVGFDIDEASKEKEQVK